VTRKELLERYAQGERDFKEVNLQNVDLQGTDLRGNDLCHTDLQGANLSWADLQGTNLSRADLRGANLRRANLQYTDLEEADLRGAYLENANLKNANLIDVDLLGSYLQGADLQGADLQGADLQGADLRNTDLREVNLMGADLQDADLREANLQGINLEEANLFRTNLEGAIMSKVETDSKNTQMEWDSDLSKCRVGDYVASARYGWVEIVTHDKSDTEGYPIRIKERGSWFTYEGFLDKGDKAPSIFVTPPQWLLEIIGPKPAPRMTELEILIQEIRKDIIDKRLDSAMISLDDAARLATEYFPKDKK